LPGTCDARLAGLTHSLGPAATLNDRPKSASPKVFRLDSYAISPDHVVIPLWADAGQPFRNRIMEGLATIHADRRNAERLVFGLRFFFLERRASVWKRLNL